jgi:hypothetical protein
LAAASVSFIGFFALAAVVFARPAAAAEVYSTEEVKSMVRLVGELPDQTQTMGTHLMLVALEIDKEAHLEHVRKGREYFIRVLDILSVGDPENGVEAPSDPKVRGALARLQGLWLTFEPMVRKGLETKSVAAGELMDISRITAPLNSTAEEVANAVEAAYATESMSSVLLPIVEESVRQGTRIQQMLKQVVMISYGHDVGGNKQSLAAGVALFDRVLKGLIRGDAELRLVPAMNLEIGSQLKKVERIWSDFQPLVKAASESDRIDRQAVAQVAELGVELYQEMEEVTELYDEL